MKDFKGTPGPWTGKDMFRGVVLSGEGLSLSCGLASKEAKANGKLALAAPDLLEALQDLLSGWKYIRAQHGDLYGVGWDRAQDKAQAAISKALGEE